MRIAILLIAATFAASFAFAARPIPLSGDPLMGDWKITVTPSGTDANSSAKKFDETLSFDGSKMSAKTLAGRGFKSASYNEDVRAYGPAKFDCKQESEKEGHVAWTGVADGGQLKGTMVWTAKDGKETHYDFEGSKAGQ